jgi:hypothetical protein
VCGSARCEWRLPGDEGLSEPSRHIGGVQSGGMCDQRTSLPAARQLTSQRRDKVIQTQAHLGWHSVNTTVRCGLRGMDFLEATRTAPAILYSKYLIVPKRWSLRCAVSGVLDGSMTLMHSRNIEGLPPYSALMLDEPEADTRVSGCCAFEHLSVASAPSALSSSRGPTICLPIYPSDSGIAEEIARAQRRLQVNSAAQATLARGAWRERFACTHG